MHVQLSMLGLTSLCGGLRYALNDRVGQLQVQAMAEAAAKANLGEEICDTQHGPLCKKAKVEELMKESPMNNHSKLEPKKEEQRRLSNSNNDNSRE